MSQFAESDRESSFEVINLGDSSADCSMEIVGDSDVKTSEFLREEADVFDPESSFEIIDDSEASETPEAAWPSETQAEKESSEAPKPSESFEAEEVASESTQDTFKPPGTYKRFRKLARKFKELSGKVEKFEKFEAARDAQNDRPILEEISGTWKLIERRGRYTPIPNRDLLKIKVTGARVNISTIKESRIVLRRTGLITSKHSVRTEYHDYIENNQWITVHKEASRSNVKRIINGQLRIKFQLGENTVIDVFERTQDIKTSDVSDSIFTVILIAACLLVVRFIASPVVDFAVISFFIMLIGTLILRSSF